MFEMYSLEYFMHA